MRGGRMLWVAVWASSAFTSSASVLGIVSSALAGVAVGRVSTSGAWDRLRQSQVHDYTALTNTVCGVLVCHVDRCSFMNMIRRLLCRAGRSARSVLRFFH